MWNCNINAIYLNSLVNLRVLELQQNILLKEALIRQQEKEIEKLTTLLNKALNDSEVE